MSELPETLRDNVRLLGDLLGATIREHEGQALFDKVEEVRQLGKAAQAEDDAAPLVDLLGQLDDAHILPIVRAFNQFLNLANIAEQEYYASAEAEKGDGLQAMLLELSAEYGKEKLAAVIRDLRIDLVLTAHPTEVTRRTLIRKYDQVVNTLVDRKRGNLLAYEEDKHYGRLHRLVEEIWSTDEIRSERPSAVDEAKWGFAVIENSLWQAVPDFIRHLDRLSCRQLDQCLPVGLRPLKVYAWRGGDRDATPAAAGDARLVGRTTAAGPYRQDVHGLGTGLSTPHADAELRARYRDTGTPYPATLPAIPKRLNVTLRWTDASFRGRNV